MGIGASILEEYIYQNGLMVNSSYGDYRIPTFQEMPSNKCLSVSFSVDPLPDGPWGAKGLGEGTMVAVAPAIANAVYNAVGIRIKDLPLSAERVFMSIRLKDQEVETSEDSIQKLREGISANVGGTEDVKNK
jgi:CO/xanthine dehydrogenase Mo-binding subunit